MNTYKAETIMKTLGVAGVYWNETFELRLQGIRANNKGFSVSVYLYHNEELIERVNKTAESPLEAMVEILKRIESLLKPEMGTK